jgi:hypothetical protein
MEILCTLWGTPSPGLFENAVLIRITNCQLIILNILFTFFKKKETVFTSEYNEVNVEKQNITKLTIIIYPIHITDDNYINILRVAYTQTSVPLRK